MKPSTDRLAVYRGGAHAAAVSPVGPAFTAVPGCPGAGKKRNPNRAIGTGRGVGARSASPVSALSRRTWPGEELRWRHGRGESYGALGSRLDQTW